MVFILLLACRTAELLDACEGDQTDTATCIPCASSEECGITGNPCLETAWCAHEQALIAVPDIGCSAALEYRWPPDDRCACVEGLCAAQ